MNSSSWGLFAIAVAIAFVGALAVGVPLATLAVLLVVLACPLMMVLMMRGMHSGSEDHPAPREDDRHRQR